jgi:hypothetical protein
MAAVIDAQDRRRVHPGDHSLITTPQSPTSLAGEQRRAPAGTSTGAISAQRGRGATDTIATVAHSKR